MLLQSDDIARVGSPVDVGAHANVALPQKQLVGILGYFSRNEVLPFDVVDRTFPREFLLRRYGDAECTII